MIVGATAASTRRVRPVVPLAAVGLVDVGLIALRQLGVLSHLPDVASTDEVVTSPAANVLGVPDGLVGAALYGAELAWRRDRTVVRVLSAVALVGTVRGIVQMVRQRRACGWCVVAGVLNVAIAAAAWHGER